MNFQLILATLFSFFGFDLSGFWTAIGKALGVPLCLAVMLVTMAGVSGCGAPEGFINANPQTKAHIGPFSFSNNKDVQIGLVKGSYNDKTGLWELQGLTVIDNASAVRDVNGRVQIPAAGQYVLDNGTMISGVIDASGRFVQTAGNAILPGGLPAYAIARGTANAVSRPTTSFTGPGGIGMTSGMGEIDRGQLLGTYYSSQLNSAQLESQMTPEEVAAAKAAVAARKTAALKAANDARIAQAKADLAAAEAASTQPAQ